MQLDAKKIQRCSAPVRPSRVAYSLLSSAARARISSRLCISPTVSASSHNNERSSGYRVLTAAGGRLLTT